MVLRTTVSRRGSFHEHYNHRCGLGEEHVFVVRNGCCGSCIAATGVQAGCVCPLVGSAASRNAVSDGGVQRGVAIANKHARQIWVMLAHIFDYDPCGCLQHPMHRHTHAAHAA